VNRQAVGQTTPFQRLPRTLRLKKQSLIRPLFDRKRNDVGSVATGSIRLIYRTLDRSEAGVYVPIQVGFAPGRAETAVRRNRIKRILREVYRVNQQSLIDLFSDTPLLLTLMVLFRGRTDSPEEDIRRDLPNALHELARRLNESSMRVEQH
jgi:ribonuclease P protein component